MIKAIIFDFDGTILETELPDYSSWNEIYVEHGAELPLSVWGQFIGTTAGGFDPYGYLEQVIGQTINSDEIRSRRRKRYEQLVLQEAVMPGIESLIREARMNGLKVGLATSSSRQWVEGHLTRLRLLEQFDCILTSDHVVRVKPDPELYIRALAALGVEGREAFAIEDSPNGSRAAKRAGMYCIVVPNTLTKQLAFDPVDATYDCLEGKNLAAILADLGQDKEKA